MKVLTGLIIAIILFFFIDSYPEYFFTEDIEKRKIADSEIAPIIKQMPNNAKNITNIGGRWFYFELDGNCYILADHGIGSVLSTQKCKK
jgi:hypothetical protein